MRVVVFGASGGTGRRLVAAARDAGHEVTAVVREGAPPVDGARPVTADVLDGEAVARAVAGHDAILSALGQRRAAKNPFARMLSPPDLMQRATAGLVAAARAHRIERLFVVSLHGAGDSLERTGWLYRWLVTRTQIRHALADSNVMEERMRASGLDWIAARPVTLTDGAGRGRWRMRDDRIGSLATIARADVAAYLIGQLTSAERASRTPSLTA